MLPFKLYFQAMDDSAITPARRMTLNKDITNQILDLISDGKWKEGPRIPGEIGLERMFEVSRNSVRETLKSLELIGILRAKSGSGTYVTDQAVAIIKQTRLANLPQDESSLIEIMETRIIMEPGVVRIAAERAGKEDYARLHAIVDMCIKAVEEKSYNFELGFRFHAALFQTAGNRILNGIADQLRASLIIARRDIYFEHFDLKNHLKEIHEHKAILDYMEAGEVNKAVQTMEKHLSESLARWKKIKGKL